MKIDIDSANATETFEFEPPDYVPIFRCNNSVVLLGSSAFYLLCRHQFALYLLFYSSRRTLCGVVIVSSGVWMV